MKHFINEETKMSKSSIKKSESDISIPETILTTSGKIRYLDSQNLTRGQISKVLNIRYQHVRNVLITPVKNPK